MRSLILGGAALLAACSTTPRLDLPAAPVAPAYPVVEGGVAADMPTARSLAWRQVYGDPRLQALISLALDQSRDLRTALLNVEAARAERRIARSPLGPSLDVGLSQTRERSPTQGRSDTYSVNLGLTAFELDLFGRLRAESSAAYERYLASETGARAARIALISAVATAYLDERLAAEQLTLTEATLADWRASFDIAQRLKSASQASGLDVAQAEGLVRQAEADREAGRRALAQARNALELVVGGPVPASLPTAISLADQPLPTQLEPGLPADLLVLRPDIAQAEHMLRAANANVGAARAAFLPRISLSGAFGGASTDLGALFNPASRAWSFAPQITQPIFRNGQLRGGLALTEARKSIAVAAYERQIQVAFREVADGLAAQATFANQAHVQKGAADAASRRLHLSSLRYRSGLDGRLELLDAQRADYAARQTLLSLRHDQLASMVALYAALGGGLDRPQSREDLR
ncbi:MULTISPECIES: efflux transporter outer membrane subunit [unclassified Caulobacter]|uniref:efflux transporter outer membrane subunit n=1 Tax=unclassified Caulobacter TaxID=2648921 RepID=UPI000784C3E3|nr:MULTISPECIES: efflux transporter outer membrane subunit [unclassified Caulobacter]AZS21209.1 efflux transporter outer membrane subunit [Caulobacter sp. FWC26]